MQGVLGGCVPLLAVLQQDLTRIEENNQSHLKVLPFCCTLSSHSAALSVAILLHSQ
jgi:hypothetical protein